ncbi:DUF4349 domain-containing protein [Crenobacter sp. SG2303]|uniref:DUF4349 domain-containing protein n=1 Tax=Crenobacter oryzisoli TaxID=3056844 RepID=A0ABT7XKW4_9NEIS|nr:DUF4349 domain-containing protein [Crenobacter sp. SG2303]MDN0074434.1 DUF4349 domain-containing protein [Crenobacter sp. SG2303]
MFTNISPEGWRRGSRAAALFMVLLASACGKKDMPPDGSGAPLEASSPAATIAAMADKAGRLVAMNHLIGVVTDGDKQEKAWLAILAQCAELDCYARKASFGGDEDAPAHLELSVARPDVDKMVGTIRAQGKVRSYQLEQQDRTEDMVALNEQIRSQQALRDKLQAEQPKATPGGATASPLAEQQEAARQNMAQLTAQQAALSLAVRRDTVVVDLSAEGGAWQSKTWQPVAKAWAASAGLFASSLGVVLSVVACVAPWALALLLLIALVRAVRRYCFTPRSGALPVPEAEQRTD